MTVFTKAEAHINSHQSTWKSYHMMLQEEKPIEITWCSYRYAEHNFEQQFNFITTWSLYTQSIHLDKVLCSFWRKDNYTNYWGCCDDASSDSEEPGCDPYLIRSRAIQSPITKASFVTKRGVWSHQGDPLTAGLWALPKHRWSTFYSEHLPTSDRLLKICLLLNDTFSGN